MSFFGFMSSPVSIPPVFDTTPCLEHLMEYEDCAIDVGTPKTQFLMPAWSTLWPRLHEGKTNMRIDARFKDTLLHPTWERRPQADAEPLSDTQMQLLYECEEERMVVKACMRELIKLKRKPNHTSWRTAEAANMCLD